jgi:hypothetical protein
VTLSEQVRADAWRLATDPAGFFGRSRYAMQHIAPDRLAELQLEALRMRFADLRGRIPVLTAMAHEQGIDRIESVEDVVALLFQHSVYKSYPLSLLENNRFDALTRWLDRLTTVDLSGIDASGCDGIDSWLGLLDTRTELRVVHSSGTSGTMSFLPRSAVGFDRMAATMRCGLFQFSDPEDRQDHSGEFFQVVWPSYRHGRSAIMRQPDLVLEQYYAGGPDRVHALHPGSMSSDAMFLAARLRAAAARGEQHLVQISPTLKARREEFLAAQRDLENAMPRFLDEVTTKLQGERIYIFGTWNMLHHMAKAGLERGLEGVFAAGSVATVGGGAKGLVQPAGWEEDVTRFLGVPRLQHVYAMTEAMAMHKACEFHRFHIEPWFLLYLLDPDDGRLLPRQGVQTGRAAFYDLTADTYWGGAISGDEVTVDWSPCPCRQTSPHLARQIERYSDKRGGDDKITCAASDEAHANAIAFLNEHLDGAEQTCNS